MNLSPEDLAREVVATGFQAEPLEKAIRLLGLLNAMREHTYLRGRLALKGGTALNLFLFEVPRLSVDIDLNYIGAATREQMLAERPQVERAIEAVCHREGLSVRRVPEEHAGGKWRITYTSTTGGAGHLEIDVNFLLRTPLWPPVIMNSRSIGFYQATDVPVLDPHEIAAGKLAALVARIASRDLFDAHGLLKRDDLDLAKLRLAFMVYGGANRKDWRTVRREDLTLDPREVRQQLAPMLRTGILPMDDRLANWSDELLAEVTRLLGMLLPLSTDEHEFFDRLNDRGEIAPELLTRDDSMQGLIRGHPALLWKAQNVRKHHMLTDET